MQRDRFWDIIKGLAILLVILGHAIEYGGGFWYRDSGDYYNNPLFLFIYSFHMPLFMMISGYFYYHTESHRNGPEILKAKIRGLFVPILFFTLFNTILAVRPPLGLKSIALDYLHRLPNTLWFLWDLLIFAAIKVLQNKYRWNHVGVDVLLCLVLCLLPNQPMGAFIAFMYPFFCLGYYANKFKSLEQLDKRINIVVPISLVVFIALLCFFTPDFLVYKSGTSLLAGISVIGQLWYNCFRLVIGLAGSVFIISSVKWLKGQLSKETRVGNIMGLLGVYSMGIYCFQDISLCLYHHFTKVVAQPTIIWWICAFAMILIMCLVMTIVTSRINILNKYLLGGR